MLQKETKSSIDWAALGWQYLFFFYFSGVIQILVKFSKTSATGGLRLALLMSVLWLIPTLLFPKKTRTITIIIGLVLWATSLISLGYFFIYRQELSQSVIFIAFESNLTESSEYLANYFRWWMLAGFLLYTAGAFFLWRQVRPVVLPKKNAFMATLLILPSLLGKPLYADMTKSEDVYADKFDYLEAQMEPAVPWRLLIGYKRYQEELATMQTLLTENSKVAPVNNLHDNLSGQPATLVLVIGESTNRQRMSLYGYSRKTTPNLDAMQNELLTFTNVISPRPYTIEALEQALTFGDQDHLAFFKSKPTLMNMMKQAGYKTYWITNQQTITKRNTMLTTFSKQTDEQYYLNNNPDQNDTRQYDADVLLPFKNILKQPEPRKFIVIHLLGTHISYNFRYPQEFAKFTDRQGVPAWVKNNELDVYNAYDNAILYNDFIISSLIKEFSANQPNGLLLYMSDHGEDVFDEPGRDFNGRDEGNPTKPMYTIPFMVWTSKKWQEKHPQLHSSILNRPYNTSYFINTWADLAGLQFDEFDPSKSLINRKFKERTLLIGNPYENKKLTNFAQLQQAALH